MLSSYPELVREVESEPGRAQDHAWFSWRERDLEEVSKREAFNVGFRRGAQWATRLSGQLSPHLAELSVFMVWLLERPADDWQNEPSNGSTPTGDSNDPW